MADTVTTTHVYRVTVTREGDWWLADVPELPGAYTYARTLTGLGRKVREVIALMAELPESDLDGVEISLAFQLPDPVTKALREAEEAGHQRYDGQDRTEEAIRRAIAAIEKMAPGVGTRDIAAVLGMPYERVRRLRTVEQF